jgi:hypothetical protein
MSLAEVLEEFPSELRLPLVRLVDVLKAEFVIQRADFEDLKAIVRDLAKSQQELAEAQKRTEQRVEELAEAQKRTEHQVGELAEAQKRTESALTLFQRTFTAQVGGLGARWGIQTEESFRQGMRAILQEVGFTTERFLDYDKDGEVFGTPEQVEVDVVIQNGKVFVLEIKSSVSKADVVSFDKKVSYYARKSGRAVTRKLIVTPYLDSRAQEISQRLGMEICTDVNTLSSEVAGV